MSPTRLQLLVKPLSKVSISFLTPLLIVDNLRDKISLGLMQFMSKLITPFWLSKPVQEPSIPSLVPSPSPTVLYPLPLPEESDLNSVEAIMADILAATTAAINVANMAKAVIPFLSEGDAAKIKAQLATMQTQSASAFTVTEAKVTAELQREGNGGL